MNLKLQIKNDILKTLTDVSMEEIFIESPKDRKLGDYAVPCFILSKKLRKSPVEIANEIKNNIDMQYYEKVEVVSGYLNIFVKKDLLVKHILEEVRDKEYGSNDIGLGKTMVIDYSSPNIAKPFGVGHLRSTSIGNAIKNIALKSGYKVVGVNHLGDWGTQYGKLICAYNKWGNHEEIMKDPIAELTKLYVLFHQEVENNPSLEDEARRCFKELEDGDQKALELWKIFRDESLKEFEKTYNLLGINQFDSYNGEAFYNDKMQPVIDELEQKGLLKLSEGASIVELEDIAPALIKKSDGATLYITRDLATAIYRKNTYHFDESIYVVGNEQSLHFKQLKMVLDKMGYDWQKDIHHINFGLILQDGKKMSTRRGKSVVLHNVLEEAVAMAANYVSDNNDIDKNEVSRQIGIGAVLFNDLKNYRINDIEFNLNDILKFEGETGPYVQYTYARISSLLKNKKNIEIDFNKINITESVWNTVFKLYEFKDIVIKAKEGYDPSLVAKYAIDVAQEFNRFYASEKIIDNDLNYTEFKLKVCESVSIILKESLRLLGIEAPEKM
jgi:arginyl-tRNA synthetase